MKKQVLLLSWMIALSLSLLGCELLTEGRSHGSAQPTLPTIAFTTPTMQTTASPWPAASLSPSASASPINQSTPSPSVSATARPTSSPTASATASQSAIAVVLLENTTVKVDCTGDNKSDTVNVETKSGMTTIHIQSSSGQEASLSVDSDFVSAYVYRNKSGKSCVLLSTERSCDEYVTMVYGIDGSSLTFQKTCTVPGYILSMSGASVRLFDYVSVLGCWDAYRDYALNSSLVLGASGDGLWHITGPNRQLIVKTSLSTQVKKNGSYTQTTLAKGTRLRIVSTDAKNYLLFKLSDGREGKLAFSVATSGIQIGGKAEAYWFDGILTIA